MDALKNKVIARIEALTPKSAWSRGVKVYALELLDETWVKLEGLKSHSEIRTHLLNGADTWTQYSEGGCSLIYNGDIAERLCTPSELKRNKDGERNPNSRETWLDVQARALWQACRLIFNEVTKELNQN